MAIVPKSGRQVYIIGAQCTGKSTLINALETCCQPSSAGITGKEPRPAFICEVARKVLKVHNFSREDIMNSPTRALQLQKYIIEAQLSAEKAAANDPSVSWCVCDRSGLDPIVYAQVFVGKEAAEEMLASPTWKELEKRMKEGLVFLCEAGCSWLVDDGTRLMPDGIEGWMRVDREFRELLEARGITYRVISRHLVDLGERVQLIREAMDAVHG